MNDQMMMFYTPQNMTKYALPPSQAKSGKIFYNLATLYLLLVLIVLGYLLYASLVHN